MLLALSSLSSLSTLATAALASAGGAVLGLGGLGSGLGLGGLGSLGGRGLSRGLVGLASVVLPGAAERTALVGDVVGGGALLVDRGGGDVGSGGRVDQVDVLDLAVLEQGRPLEVPPKVGVLGAVREFLPPFLALGREEVDVALAALSQSLRDETAAEPVRLDLLGGRLVAVHGRGLGDVLGQVQTVRVHLVVDVVVGDAALDLLADAHEAAGLGGVLVVPLLGLDLAVLAVQAVVEQAGLVLGDLLLLDLVGEELDGDHRLLGGSTSGELVALRASDRDQLGGHWNGGGDAQQQKEGGQQGCHRGNGDDASHFDGWAVEDN